MGLSSQRRWSVEKCPCNNSRKFSKWRVVPHLFSIDVRETLINYIIGDLIGSNRIVWVPSLCGVFTTILCLRGSNFGEWGIRQGLVDVGRCRPNQSWRAGHAQNMAGWLRKDCWNLPMIIVNSEEHIQRCQWWCDATKIIKHNSSQRGLCHC
jgi:hypothetical protein